MIRQNKTISMLHPSEYVKLLHGFDRYITCCEAYRSVLRQRGILYYRFWKGGLTLFDV